MNLLFWRKKRTEPKDPVAAFDAAIDRLERRAAKVRQAAAVLISMQAQTAAEVERARAQLEEISRRIGEAARAGDSRSREVLEDALRRAGEGKTALEAELARSRRDAEQLKEAARDLADEIAGLRREQAQVKVRLAAGEAITRAFHSRSDAFDAALQLDDARGEVERAHALAELYREAK